MPAATGKTARSSPTTASSPRAIRAIWKRSAKRSSRKCAKASTSAAPRSKQTSAPRGETKRGCPSRDGMKKALPDRQNLHLTAGDLDALAGRLAEQRARQRRDVRQRALCRRCFVFADNAESVGAAVL